MYKIFSRTGCPYCIKAVETLAGLNVEINETKLDDILERNAFYDEHKLEGKNRTVREIWKIEDDGSETYIGGYTQLRRFLA